MSSKTCLSCGRGVNPKWHDCQWCGASLIAPLAPPVSAVRKPLTISRAGVCFCLALVAFVGCVYVQGNGKSGPWPAYEPYGAYVRMDALDVEDYFVQMEELTEYHNEKVAHEIMDEIRVFAFGFLTFLTLMWWVSSSVGKERS